MLIKATWVTRPTCDDRFAFPREGENVLFFFFHSRRFFRKPKKKEGRSFTKHKLCLFSHSVTFFSSSIFSLLPDQTCPVVPELCCRLSFEHHLSSKTARLFFFLFLLLFSALVLFLAQRNFTSSSKREDKKVKRKNNLTVFGLWSGSARPSEFCLFSEPTPKSWWWGGGLWPIAAVGLRKKKGKS